MHIIVNWTCNGLLPNRKIEIKKNLPTIIKKKKKFPYFVDKKTSEFGFFVFNGMSNIVIYLMPKRPS